MTTPLASPDEAASLTDERHAWLLAQLDETRRITTNLAAETLRVSVDTIRRDLRSLHDQGLLRRVHGGALPVPRLPASYTGRANEESPDRAALALAVVGRFRAGQVIGLDGGSTCAEIAAMIPQTLAVTIITNNPVAAVALADHRSVEVTLLGGNLDLTWMATTGADTVDAWRNYRLDLGVLGVCGLDPEAGATTNSEREVATKRALIAAAAEVVVPLQPEKLGETAPFVITGLDAISAVAIAQGESDTPDSSLLEALDSAGIEVTSA